MQSVLLTGPPQTAPSGRLARITVEQYHRMLEVGILRECEPIELLDGLLVLKDRSGRGEDWRTIGKAHAVAVCLLSGLDAVLAPQHCHMRIQAPITLAPKDEPEPDGAVVRGEPRDYLSGHPVPANVCCVLEVADSSLEYDRTTKLEVYARAGVPQYLIVNLVDRRVELFSEPIVSEGRYARSANLEAGVSVSLQVAADQVVAVPVRELLP
ncbi:MAG: Uma2 family endonuclease [Planctomycetes bacterium]|nr:Uma2 family endonuclease [Planctomycetota bacterium]